MIAVKTKVGNPGLIVGYKVAVAKEQITRTTTWTFPLLCEQLLLLNEE